MPLDELQAADVRKGWEMMPHIGMLLMNESESDAHKIGVINVCFRHIDRAMDIMFHELIGESE